MAIGTQTLVTGQRTTLNTDGTNLHVRDVEDKIRLLSPYPTPIDNWFMINDKYATEVTTGLRGKFEWYEDAYLPSIVTVTTAVTGGGATDSIVVSANYFKVNDVFIAEATDQVLLVTAVSTGTLTITVAPAYGGTVTAIPAGTVLQVLTNAYAEGGSKGTSLTVVAANKYGYPQIMNKLLSMSGTQQASKQYGGPDWKYQWQKALLELRESWERAMLEQGASYDDSTTGRTFSAGFHSLSTNLFPYSGTLTKSYFDSAVKQTMQNGSQSRLLCFAGPDALTDISAFVQQNWSIQQTGSTMKIASYGLLTTSPSDTKMLDYIHPMGIVEIHYDPQLKSKYAGDFIFMQPENIKKRYMDADEKGPRKYRLEMGIETPGDDSYDAQYKMHQGLQIILEETHGRGNKV